MILSVEELSFSGFALDGISIQATIFESAVLFSSIIVLVGIYVYIVKLLENT